jgi:CubicO group peptidase (beta-lactamase class C family)
MVLDGGRVGDAQVTPETWIDGMRRGEREKFDFPYTNILPKGAYRRFWWIRDADRGDLAARGVFGQLIYADRHSDLLVVKLSTWPDYVIPAFAKDTFRAIDAIRRALEN